MAKALVIWPRFSLTSFNMVYGLVQQGVTPSTIIDVGANAGQFAIASVKLFSGVSVHSFEPHPECYGLLKKNVSSLHNIFIYPIALGSKVGEMTLHLNAFSHSSSLLPLSKNHLAAFPSAHETDAVSVKISTLDFVFSDIDLPPPVLLKIDVQGYEAEVLRGAVNTLKRIDYVVLESSFKSMYQGEMLFMQILDLMKNLGFSFLRPVGLLAVPNTDEIVQIDALFERVDSSYRMHH